MQTTIYTLLSLTVFITSSNGQVITNLPKDSVGVPKTISVGQPKLVKTQGTNEYANIHCGLMDKAGNLWFGTTGEGVYRYDGKRFTQFTIQDGLSSNTVWSILLDSIGNIWFGTEAGPCRYDGKAIMSIPIFVMNRFSFYQNNSSNNYPSEKAVWSMMQDKSGKLWFGTTTGVYCYNGKVFTRFLDNDTLINNNKLHLKMIDCMMEDKKGDLWFGSGMPPGGEGVCHYDGKSITSFKPNGSGWIRTILEDKNGNLCIASRHYGVCRYDRKIITNFTEQAGINNSDVTYIVEDKAGNIWIATEHGSGELGEDGGVWRYDGKSFTKFTTKEGLVHNGIFWQLFTT